MAATSSVRLGYLVIDCKTGCTAFLSCLCSSRPPSSQYEGIARVCPPASFQLAKPLRKCGIMQKRMLSPGHIMYDSNRPMEKLSRNWTCFHVFRPRAQHMSNPSPRRSLYFISCRNGRSSLVRAFASEAKGQCYKLRKTDHSMLPVTSLSLNCSSYSFPASLPNGWTPRDSSPLRWPTMYRIGNGLRSEAGEVPSRSEAGEVPLTARNLHARWHVR